MYERYLTCTKCGSEMRQTANLPLNEGGEKHVRIWERKFQEEHLTLKNPHSPRIQYTNWQKLT